MREGAYGYLHALVRAAVGVSRAMRPREAIAKLVEYFRGFSDSAERPPSRPWRQSVRTSRNPASGPLIVYEPA